MADWKTYAKAARNTAKRQARTAMRSSAQRDSRDERDRYDRDRDDRPRGRTLTGGDYARAARKALDEGTRDSRESLRRSSQQTRRNAAAYAAVAQRRAQKAQIGKRISAAFRDAVLVGLSLFVIWFVVTRTGVQIPFTAVLVVVGIIAAARFGWVLYTQFARRDREDPPDDEDRA